MRNNVDNLLVIVAVAGLAVGLLLQWSGHNQAATWAWGTGTLPIIAALLFQIITSLRKGDVGLDVIAGLSMSAALVFGEPLAANVVALMYSGGQLLESFAQGRASKEMTALLGRVAHTAMRYSDGGLQETPVDDIVPGDRLLIREGEVLPVDGRVISTVGVLDLSTLTGETQPKQILQGEEALSGTTSVGPPFDLLATRPARESTYAGIVKLVEGAQQGKAPMVRMADQYSVWFLALTLLIAGASWLLTGDTTRLVAVLVVATPCPLILAVPVALISGMSRAAKGGVLVKNGAVFENLAKVKIAILDKTGTITHGRAEISEIKTYTDVAPLEILRLAASLDQASSHVVASTLIGAAREQALHLSVPTEVDETPGKGVQGIVDGINVCVGEPDWVIEQVIPSADSNVPTSEASSSMSVMVTRGTAIIGQIFLEDPMREDAGGVLKELRAAGVQRMILASGDRAIVAESIGAHLGFDAVLGDLTPQDKLDVVQRESATGCTMMVGDGINDAPALALADVGVAMGAKGAAASSEAAGVVVLVDQLAPLAQAIKTARRSRAIAMQSVVAGLSLSVIAMCVAAIGLLPPVQGAVIQEGIDVAVILNALRALR